MEKHIKIGLVHDWLVSMRGGEKVFEAICELFPGAPIGTLVHRPGSVSPVIENHPIKTSFIQHFPLAREKYQYYLPLFPSAAEALDFSNFDCVISSSHAVAKGVRLGRNTLHICYCHTPMRYIWDQYENYFGKGRSSIWLRGGMRFFLPYLRKCDLMSSRQVTHFIANSRNVRNRIKRLYGRESEVIFPPVDTSGFSTSSFDEGYYLLVSALVPYKRTDIAVDAFNRLGARLVIVGSGAEETRLRAGARRNIEFTGWVGGEALKKLYSGCRALIFPSEEDFGIVPVEAMAAGKPVVAYGAGGALETVIDGVTGLFFRNQDPGSLCEAVGRLDDFNFDSGVIKRHAGQFDRTVFMEKMERFIEKKIGEWQA